MTPDDQVRRECEAFLAQDIGLSHVVDTTLNATVRFAHQQQAVGLRLAIPMVCARCREGMPLQKNGGWHNDKHGKDTLLNNCCHGAVIEFAAKALEGK